MNKKLAAEHIDFADSEFKSFHMSENETLTIYLTSWDIKRLKVIFVNMIQFSYKLGDSPQDLYELSEGPFLEEALFQEYGYKPSDYLFKLFHLEDICKFPFIQVVAESCLVSQQPRSKLRGMLRHV